MRIAKKFKRFRKQWSRAWKIVWEKIKMELFKIMSEANLYERSEISLISWTILIRIKEIQMQSEKSRGHMVHVQLFGHSWASSEPFLAIRWHSPWKARDFGSKNDQSSQLGRVWHRSRHWDFSVISIAKKINLKYLFFLFT